jgi:hypothetical protein
VLRILETTSQTTLKPLVIFKIDRKAYYSVAERLEQTLRYFDYDPDREILTIRMPTPIHEFFTASLNRYIERQLESIASRPGEAGEVASKIESGGSSRILLREGIPEGNCPLQHHPDGQFFYEHGKYPIVVLEISYSQARKRLRKLAQDYILYSNGNIKLVIGIDINYKNKESQEATVSLWRPKYTRQDEDDDVLEVEQKMINHVRCFRVLSDIRQALTVGCSHFEPRMVRRLMRRIISTLTSATFLRTKYLGVLSPRCSQFLLVY